MNMKVPEITKKTGAILFAVVFSTALTAGGQKAMASAVKEMVIMYEEQFNDNENKWEVFDSPTASAQISGGEYFIESKRQAGSYIVLHFHDFPHDTDFTVETAVTTVMRSGSYSYGYVFGALDILNNYSFQVVDNQRFSIRKDSDGVSRELYEGNISALNIEPRSQTRLRIVKQGKDLSFFINGNLVHTVSDISFFGNKVGFIVQGKAKIAVDWTRTQTRTQQG